MAFDTGGAASWRRLKQAFTRAVELDGPERAAYLASLADDDSGLARELSTLLEAHDKAERGCHGGREQERTGRDPPLIASDEPTRAPGEPSPGRDQPASADPSLPAHIGRYTVLRLLGTGGMGRVLLARDPQLERDVALKLLPPELAADPSHRARLLREARAAAGLNHPSITTIHEVGTADGQDYIAMEYVQGDTLRALLARRRLPLPELLALAAPLAEALAFAHERGVLHRDVKASNVMVPPRGPPRLLDFGLARRRALPGQSGETITLEGTIFGTPGAMSPEQALGRALDARSDVFSFGSLLYEMATGQPAFRGDTSMATLDAVIHAPPPALATLREDLPEAFVALVERCLEKDPARRPASMDRVAEALRVLRAGATEAESRVGAPGDAGVGVAPRAGVPRDGSPSGPAPSSTGAAPGLRRSRRRGRALLALTLLLVTALAWWLGRATTGGAKQPTPRAAAVLCFDNLDDARDDGQLAAMLARLVGAELGAGGQLPVVSQQHLFDVARLAGLDDLREGAIPRQHATEVARRAGVDVMILGQVGHAGQRLVSTLELVDVASGASLGSPAAEVDGPEQVFELAAKLGRGVRTLLAAPDPRPDERQALQRQLTTSVQAYRAFVTGQRLLLASQIPAAVTAFRQATEADPAFALAWFRLATALVWTGDDQGPARALEHAVAFRDRLPPETARLLDAARPYYFDDDTRAALPLLEALLADDPWQRDALYMLGEIVTHSATRNDTGRAIEVYDRLLTLEPGFSLVYEHALSADLRAGHWARAADRVQAWRLSGLADVNHYAGLLALWQGHPEQAVAARPDDRAAALLALSQDPARFAAAPPPDTTRERQRLAHLEGLYRCVETDLAAAAQVYAGRFDRATALYTEAVAVPGAHSLDGFLTSARDGARQRLAELLALRGELDAAREQVAAALLQQPDSYRCLYVSALFAARAGDRDELDRCARVLVDLAARDWSPSAELYRDATLAEQQLLAGQAEPAHALLEGLVHSGRLMEDWYAHEDSLGPWVREALARACAALGDRNGEREALSGLVDSGLERLRHPVLWVAAIGRLGLLALDAGEQATGRAQLERFLLHWGATDLPLVEQARARLDE